MFIKFFKNKKIILRTEVVNKTSIAYNEAHAIHIRQYYLFCLMLLKNELLKTDLPVNIIFGNYKAKFLNKHRTYKIDIQYEHTLVKGGGRDSKKSITGKIEADDGSLYLVRITNYKYYFLLDFIIDYSLPNIINIQQSGQFKSYVQKCFYVAPLLYPFKRDSLNRSRKNHIITTFTKEKEPRRKLLIDSLREAKLEHANVTNCFSHQEIFNLYSDAKILINIHQTQHHHTFEELRVLPALLCGCIVISEDVPLKEYIAYSKFIIWCNYDSIISKAKEVSENYERYFNSIFIESDLSQVINEMAEKNLSNIHQLVQSMKVD